MDLNMPALPDDLEAMLAVTIGEIVAAMKCNDASMYTYVDQGANVPELTVAIGVGDDAVRVATAVQSAMTKRRPPNWVKG